MLKDIKTYNNINKHMPDYQNGKIYTIRCRDDPELIYVGSTTQPLSQRWQEHKRHSKNPKHNSYNIHFYQVLRDKGIDNFYIELYIECPCENREQLTKHEGKLIREIGTINTRIAGRTDKEYQEDNKDKIKQYDKQYYINNKERLLTIITCNCGCNTTIGSKTRHEKTKKHLNLINIKNSQQDTK